MDDVIDQFGEPFEIVERYIESMDIETLMRRISVRRMAQKMIGIILITAIIGLSIFTGFCYKGYQYYKHTVITERETVIHND